MLRLLSRAVFRKTVLRLDKVISDHPGTEAAELKQQAGVQSGKGRRW